MADPAHTPADLPACPSAQGGGAGLLPPELRGWMLLLAATGAVEQRLRSVVKEHLDVSHDEFLVLCLLAEQSGEGLRMTHVAELLGRPKTRLTYQVACLQHAGLVTRKTVCGDRRGVEIALTDKARGLLREASATLSETVTEALAHVMGPEQCAALSGLLPEAGAGPGAEPKTETAPAPTGRRGPEGEHEPGQEREDAVLDGAPRPA
ncbi:MarR family winged helix-turn-helix transcriptional regulator [Streptomyces hilarionis]|uniref:MarR family winged helix-turn-helix transcriptional regulator n=1 Tax=Streptomyces hilarionis TaxID=2839954 RepID=UPI00211A21A4|nr:MarR family transcriptional regulator [Streptomyces hilarionis]MCQ9132354.1 MarR family transcriptional regulator [Streptomyces hilarionis]